LIYSNLTPFDWTSVNLRPRGGLYALYRIPINSIQTAMPRPVDPLRNPYAPGAGTPPPALRGRDGELEAFRILLERLRQGRSEKSLLVSGLRGVGKTVLLNAFASIARSENFITAASEITHETNFRALMARRTQRALGEISPARRILKETRKTLGVSPDCRASQSLAALAPHHLHWRRLAAASRAGHGGEILRRTPLRLSLSPRAIPIFCSSMEDMSGTKPQAQPLRSPTPKQSSNPCRINWTTASSACAWSDARKPNWLTCGQWEHSERGRTNLASSPPLLAETLLRIWEQPGRG